MAVNTARKRSLRRLCFYRCLSVHRGGVDGRGVCVAGGMHGGEGGYGVGMCGRGGGMYGRGGGMCGRGACMTGGHVWWGSCMVGGGVHGRGHVWQGACMHGRGAMHAMHTPPSQILQDMINEWVARILLECILVQNLLPLNSCCHGLTLLSHRLAPVPADSHRSPHVFPRHSSASYSTRKGPHTGIIYSEQ